jgi:hypothetical protein
MYHLIVCNAAKKHMDRCLKMGTKTYACQCGWGENYTTLQNSETDHGHPVVVNDIVHLKDHSDRILHPH